MKSIAFIIALVAACLAADAQYSVNWCKVAGGGGTSSNGLFSLSGTIGQPDAGGSMTGGAFSLTGGFWVLPGAVTVPGAPTLLIEPAGFGSAKVSWTPATPGWVLQEASELTGIWTNSLNGTANPVTVPAGFPRKFYRLSNTVKADP